MTNKEAQELELATWAAILAHAEVHKIDMAVETWYSHAMETAEAIDAEPYVDEDQHQSNQIRSGAWEEAACEAQAIMSDPEDASGMTGLIESLEVVIESIKD